MKWFDAGTKTFGPFIRLMNGQCTETRVSPRDRGKAGAAETRFRAGPFQGLGFGRPDQPESRALHQDPLLGRKGSPSGPLPGLPSRRALLAIRTPPLAARARADPPFQAARDPRSFSRLLPTAATSAHHRGPELCPASDVRAAAPLGRAINPTRGNPMLSPLLLRCCTVFIPHCCTVFLPHCCTVFFHHCGTVF